MASDCEQALGATDALMEEDCTVPAADDGAVTQECVALTQELNTLIMEGTDDAGYDVSKKHTLNDGEASPEREDSD
eukprot:9976636-Heterocapsa_arctica.AAC.1